MTTFDEDEKGIPTPECLSPEAPTAETARSDGPALDRRLRTACDLLPEESVVWDIGTDHAYIPIYLLRCGKCASAVASEIWGQQNGMPNCTACRNGSHFCSQTDWAKRIPQRMG